MKHVFLFLLPLLVSHAALAAPAAKGDASEWLTPPAKFLAARFVRSADTPVKNYDVILDVPPAASPKAAKPRIAQSCGDGAIDGIAWDYAKSLVTRVKTLSEMNKQKELRLQIRMVPLAVKRANFTPPPPPPGAKFYTPQLPYPRDAQIRGEVGRARVRIVFSHGRASVVIVEESTGVPSLDASAALFILDHWATGPGMENFTGVLPVTYQRSHEGHTGSYTGGF